MNNKLVHVWKYCLLFLFTYFALTFVIIVLDVNHILDLTHPTNPLIILAIATITTAVALVYKNQHLPTKSVRKRIALGSALAVFTVYFLTFLGIAFLSFNTLKITDLPFDIDAFNIKPFFLTIVIIFSAGIFYLLYLLQTLLYIVAFKIIGNSTIRSKICRIKEIPQK